MTSEIAADTVSIIGAELLNAKAALAVAEQHLARLTEELKALKESRIIHVRHSDEHP